MWSEAFHYVGNESLLFHCPREPGHTTMMPHSRVQVRSQCGLWRKNLSSLHDAHWVTLN
jgi:hypothetical protein